MDVLKCPLLMYQVVKFLSNCLIVSGYSSISMQIRMFI